MPSANGAAECIWAERIHSGRGCNVGFPCAFAKASPSCRSGLWAAHIDSDVFAIRECRALLEQRRWVGRERRQVGARVPAAEAAQAWPDETGADRRAVPTTETPHPSQPHGLGLPCGTGPLAEYVRVLETSSHTHSSGCARAKDRFCPGPVRCLTDVSPKSGPGTPQPRPHSMKLILRSAGWAGRQAREAAQVRICDDEHVAHHENDHWLKPASAPPASVPRLVWQSKVRAKQADATARIASWSRDGALRNTVGER